MDNEKTKEVRIYGLEGVDFIEVKEIEDINAFLNREKSTHESD